MHVRIAGYTDVSSNMDTGKCWIARLLINIHVFVHYLLCLDGAWGCGASVTHVKVMTSATFSCAC